MRTVIQSLSLYPRLIGFVINILQRLITKQVNQTADKVIDKIIAGEIMYVLDYDKVKFYCKCINKTRTFEVISSRYLLDTMSNK
jgi:hypothetical protein